MSVYRVDGQVKIIDCTKEEAQRQEAFQKKMGLSNEEILLRMVKDLNERVQVLERAHYGQTVN